MAKLSVSHIVSVQLELLSIIQSSRVFATQVFFNVMKSIEKQSGLVKLSIISNMKVTLIVGLRVSEALQGRC